MKYRLNLTLVLLGLILAALIALAIVVGGGGDVAINYHQKGH